MDWSDEAPSRTRGAGSFAASVERSARPSPMVSAMFRSLPCGAGNPWRGWSTKAGLASRSVIVCVNSALPSTVHAYTYNNLLAGTHGAAALQVERVSVAPGGSVKTMYIQDGGYLK